MSWVTEKGSGVRLRIHVQPRATRSEIVALHGDALKIRLAAPPVDGAANDALVLFLSQQLDVPRSALTLLSGHSSRSKVVAITGMSVDQVRHRLQL
jgi:uncharacterized protein (TIGR00251 family)